MPRILLGFLVAPPAVPETPRQEEERLDWLGMALLTPGMMALVTVIMKGNNWGWDASLTIGPAVAEVVLLAAFVLAERWLRQPILDFALFHNPRPGTDAGR
jgi:hypothetical protein